MSLYQSSNIVTSGLVFYYDMQNQTKSYKGEPTTNLYYAVNNFLNSNGNQWVNTGSAIFNNDDTSISPPTNAGNNLPSTLRITSCVTTAVGNQHCGMSTTTVSASTTYTMSIWIYIKGGATVFTGSNGAAPYIRTNINNSPIAYFSYNGSTDTTTWPRNQWIRISATGTTQSNENGIYLSSYIGNSVGDAIYYYCCQIEQKGYSTPIVAGTRSNTQALLDLTNNNTITANSLTYNSDGTFSFNGSNSYVDSGTNIPNTTAFTLECFVKPANSQVQYSGIMGNHGGLTSGIYCQQQSSSLNNYTWGYGNGSSYGIGCNFSLVSNDWHHVVLVKDSSFNRVYVNGVQVNSVTTNGIAALGGFNICFGRDYTTSRYFNGSISSGKIYNRALTAAEVQQNFNALKMRYYGENSEVPALSGYDLKLRRPELPSGWYWIKSQNMPNALRMYVDMSEEGGGYDFYPIQGTGISIGSTNAVHSGTTLGLDLVYPRSKQHWISMSNFVRNILGSTGNEYFTTVYAVHRATTGGAGSAGGNYTGYIMRDPTYYGTGAPDWRVPDGGRWWLRDTNFSEPNGDYTAYNFLGGYTFPNPYTGQDLGFNDVTPQSYTTGAYYLVSTNAKP